MDNRELDIYNGLKTIGAEIAAFFSDAIEISKLDLETKPYLLSHLAREIESGLRDILSPKNEDEILYCETCKNPINRKIGHKESIIKALGLEKETAFTKKWYKTASKFPKYAHRHGAWRNPRESGVFDKVWSDFVDILESLVGNYYAIADLLDSILEVDTPSNEILGTLENILLIESRYAYFFNNLSSKGWLKKLYHKDYFAGKNNPQPIESEDNPGYFSMPYWHALEYLEKISRNNFISPDSEVTDTLVKIIDEFLLYLPENEIRIENYRTDYQICKVIANLPSNKICDNHFEYLNLVLNSRSDSILAGPEFGNLFLKRFIEHFELEHLLESIKILFSYNINSSVAYQRVSSVFRHNFLSNIIGEYKDDILELCREDAFNIGLSILDELIKNDSSLFSLITLSAIENHHQTDTETYESQLIYFLRDSFRSLPRKKLELNILIFLRKGHSIYNRLALNAISEDASYLRHFFNWKYNPLDFIFCKHEIYRIFELHAKKFSPERIAIVINWIENSSHSSHKEQLDDKVLAYRKKEWLTPLKATNNRKILELFEKYDSINSANVEHPGFDFWHETFVGNISPLSIEEILSMSVAEIIKYFNSYSGEPEKFIDPSLDGLADQIIEAILQNPELFISDCQSIISSSAHFQYYWIRGLHESWKNGKTFEIKEVLESIESIFKVPEFWDLNNSVETHSYNNWFVSNVISFIEVGVQNDSHAFDASNLDLIKSILFLILNNDKSEINDMSEYSMTALNNSKGKIYQAIMQYCLRKARLGKETTDKWDSEVKSFIEESFTIDSTNILFYFVLGQFLTNIHYLSEDWLISNFENIFPIEKPDNWDAAMSGYLFYNSKPHKTYFEILKNNGHYEKAIKHDFKNEKQVIPNLITHICIAYGYSFENFELSDNLFQLIISEKRKDYYSNIIYNFWSPKHPLPEKVINKIKPLWKLLFNNSIEMTNPELDKYILSGCTKWLKNVKKLDNDIYNFIHSSAPYIEQYDKYSLIEYLTLHVNEESEKVAKILVNIFTYEVSYDITRGKFEELVEIIYTKGNKELADKICLLHGEQGLTFLRGIFDKYNPK